MVLLYIFGIVTLIILLSYLIIIDNKTYLKDKSKKINDLSYRELENLGENFSKHNLTKTNLIKRNIFIDDIKKIYFDILNNHDYLNDLYKNHVRISGGSQWILDNIHMIEKEYNHIMVNFPKNRKIKLPHIKNDELRLYRICEEFFLNTNLNITEEKLYSFFKEVDLTTEELWYFPLFMRIVNLNVIRDLSNKILNEEKEYLEGEYLAHEFTEIINDEELNEIINKFKNDKTQITINMAEGFLNIIRNNGIPENKILLILKDKLCLNEESILQALKNLERKKKNNEKNIGNSINSLRFIDSFKWEVFFEKVSIVEKILAKDPSGIYKKMDFQSRDYYRHKIEEISRVSNIDEKTIASTLIKCCNSKDSIKNHVGYYLIDEGIEELYKKLNINKKVNNPSNEKKLSMYIISNLLIMLIIELLIIKFLVNDLSLVTIVLNILALIPMSEIAKIFTNTILSYIISPNFIPKLSLEHGVDEDKATLVVIPAILNNKNRTEKLMRDLEIYYLTCRENNIYFALCGDFTDSNKEEGKDDNEIISAGMKIAKELNEKYGEKFLFLHRKRLYNSIDKIYMGWERKRGKITELNKLLRGDKSTSYIYGVEFLENLPCIENVITLDADTKVPLGEFKKLIGAMAHPLNYKYNIMQPRIIGDLENSTDTEFIKNYMVDKGLNIYSNMVSNIYQDVFQCGIFMGKGIYRVDEFIKLLENKFKENSVLSHDLLEGCLLHTGFLSDVTLVEGFPLNYYSYAMRLHRWVRGDIQNIIYAFNRNFSSLNRYKILDNIRRSLLYPSILFTIIVSSPGKTYNQMGWISLGFLTLAMPIIMDILTLRKSGLAKNIKNYFLVFTFFIDESCLYINAITKTLYRMVFSKKNLLQWKSAFFVENEENDSFIWYVRFMMPGLVISVLLFLISLGNSTENFKFILPSITVWILSPAIAYLVSVNWREKRESLSKEEIKKARILARRTWAYFEDFVNEENNYLGPDNYQEDPMKGIAHRTSPTNIAMTLSSNCCAYDLGYIGICTFISRTQKTLCTLKELETINGHYYNWYDTVTLKPLYPRYISTVDSGNLLSYLWLVKQCVNEYTNKPIINENFKQGIKDTMDVSMENKDLQAYFNTFLKNLEEELTIDKYKIILMEIRCRCKDIQKIEGKNYWISKLKDNVTQYIKEIQILIPWIHIVDKGNTDLYKSLRKLVFNEPLSNIPDKLNNILDKHILELDKHEELKILIRKSVKSFEKLLKELKNIEDDLEVISDGMDFSMLYDNKMGLFSIGYDVESNKLNQSYYDLMASEARIASYVAIAKGDIPKLNWKNLGRQLINMGGRKALVSWSGTMFEYLMPLIILKNYDGSIWNETYYGVVKEQKKHGFKNSIPWGVSESGYFYFDRSMIYQYKAFGIPKAGLKIGLENELVIAPYSTVMALMVDPKGALANLDRLYSLGANGRYGLYEAIDYNKERVTKGKGFSIVKSFMIHHQGMSLMSLTNILNNNIFRERFHKDSRVESCELLLQEKYCNKATFSREKVDTVKLLEKPLEDIIIRSYNTPYTEFPEIATLSNGEYNLIITNRGSGYSKLRDINLYRWKKDFINDNKGMYIYIKDINENKYWSATYEPTRINTDEYKVKFAFNKAKFNCKYNNINSSLSVDISGEDNIEIRILELENLSNEDKILEITTYSEITLTSNDGDISHPAFSNLFISTESFENNTILAYRRPRKKSDKKIYGYQRLLCDGNMVGDISYETSRLNFIGRGNTLENPKVISSSISLKNTMGAVLDPVFSQRVKVRMKKGEKSKIYILMGIEESKEDAMSTLKKYNTIDECRGILNNYNLNTREYLRSMDVKYKQTLLYDIVASRILYNIKDVLKRENFIKTLDNSQKDLWSIGISGDIPIVTVYIEDNKNIDLIRQWIQCHRYLNYRGIEFDLLIIDNEEFSYDMGLKSELIDLVNKYTSEKDSNLRGKIYVKGNESIDKHMMNFIRGISSIFVDNTEEDSFFTKLTDGYDNLEENLRGVHSNVMYKMEHQVKQVPLKWEREKYLAEFSKEDFLEDNFTKEKIYDTSKLKFFNGFGGFNEKNQYVIILKNNKNTPAPWINVISNRNFGFHISESGSSYTWYKNSRENKLTPWSNDFVNDTINEALFLRDEVSGETWSVNANLTRHESEYIIEHGFGFSKYYHSYKGISGEVTWFVPVNDNLKIGKLKLKNNLKINKKVSITYYSNLVLGVTEQSILNGISTYYNEKNNFIYGINPYNESFNKTKCYLTIVGGNEESYCCSKKDFIGVGRNLQGSIAMEEKDLNKVLSCGVNGALSYRSKIELMPNEEKELFILFGAEDSLESIGKNVENYSDKDCVYGAFEEVEDHWSNITNKYKINTPDEKINLLMNGWLIYQVISCRYYSRSAFYQCGGAFGFRDQLQDSLSIALIEPSITRQQILLSASRQFEEGDVEHWWHPVVNSGIRTKFSDDLLWLPYTVIEYISLTGDYDILKEETKYLKGDILSFNEDERYGIYDESSKVDTVYNHCKKAIDKSLKFGEHGLPLMGCGDWNDGMSNIGVEGKGESVWLAWFLSYILDNFQNLCTKMDDKETQEIYKEKRESILKNVENHGWDGNWYRRAYFDDGTPLGSIENTECMIDSLPQSWSVISQGIDKKRQIEAMNAVENHLVNKMNGMILLLYPPFDKCMLEPGYIKGYIPGVRENGGQYTHAAIWVIMATLLLKENDKAYELISMINPINHTLSSMDCEKYKLEPYVMAADVYIKEPHGGRGGWSWYTGAASWTYKVILENLLGFKLNEGKGFSIDPRIPSTWNGFNMEYKKDEDTIYKINVVRENINEILIDGIKMENKFVKFEKGIHDITIKI